MWGPFCGASERPNMLNVPKSASDWLTLAHIPSQLKLTCRYFSVPMQGLPKYAGLGTTQHFLCP